MPLNQSDNTSMNFFVENLHQIQNGFTRSLILLLLLGISGNLLSYFIFREKRFENNPISLFFSAASIFNIIVLIYGISFTLYIIDHSNPENSSNFFCQIRSYLRHVFLMIVRTYITCACVSSYLLTSTKTKLRSLCQGKYVKIVIGCVPLMWLIIPFHLIIWNRIENGKCLQHSSYVLPFGIYFLLIVGILPVLFMSLFTGLTIRNLRYLHRRIQSSFSVSQRIHSKDRQFIRMLVALVIMYILTNLFFPTNTLYLSLTHSSEKSIERVALESLIFSLTSNHILYINNVSPFFLFYFSSSTFRQCVHQFLFKLKRIFFHRDVRVRVRVFPQVHPLFITSQKNHL